MTTILLYILLMSSTYSKMADDWRTTAFRQSVAAKIDEAVRQSGQTTSRNSHEMENHVFQKAKTKEEYLGFAARVILHVREMSSRATTNCGWQKEDDRQCRISSSRRCVEESEMSVPSRGTDGAV